MNLGNIGRLVVLLSILTLCSCATMTYDKARSDFIKNPDFRAVLSTGLDSSETPVSNLDRIPATAKEIYFFVHWNRIPPVEFNYVCKIFDGIGQKVTESQMFFLPNTDGWNTWTSYKIGRNIDQPGDWKVEVYLDGNLVITREFNVVNE